jgi:hypothetical protein
MPRPWSRAALCRRFSRLPWRADPPAVSPWQVESMRTVCEACPVSRECSETAERNITSGFWAGRFRDRPVYPRTGEPL